ncbi:LytTR family DNA-binding domain-containing protein [Polyangium sp. y55x31]|uniref:LytR/AlgR family response regulator transcription factor n=1 Tax=Polyangium sp. y55x31 TaxID=3042688 RepID=UPI0024829F0E|nr:LytTR family DNA-binding domain-containing protein [Polyangium sp. y55x31]MDI1479216.1 LytTR family DNA-binding domain-containing protein [Polyangium sp. y55x31]
MNDLSGTVDSFRFRVLVVEDEWPARNYLVELLEGSHLAEVVGAVASVGEARQALQPAPAGLEVDVVFVDIALEGDDETGLDLVRASARNPRRPMFVLATAFKEHAIEAFELGVDDYLLKPFTEERVEQCLRRLAARRRLVVPQSPLRIVARRGRSLVFLEQNEVWAFEAADRLTSVHTAHGTFDLDLSLSAIEASFGRALTRVHRNWLVNAAHIKELERDGGETRVFVGVGIGLERRGVCVPVARERAQAVREMLLASATGLRRI